MAEESSYDSTQPLWKESDRKSNKTGPHHTVYWVQRNQKYLNAQRLGNKTTEEMFLVGDKYVGDWKGNKRHGFGTQTWVRGDKYEGEWREGKRYGKGTYWVKEGRKIRKQYTGDWRNNSRHVRAFILIVCDLTSLYLFRASAFSTTRTETNMKANGSTTNGMGEGRWCTKVEMYLKAIG